MATRANEGNTGTLRSSKLSPILVAGFIAIIVGSTLNGHKRLFQSGQVKISEYPKVDMDSTDTCLATGTEEYKPQITPGRPRITVSVQRCPLLALIDTLRSYGVHVLYTSILKRKHKYELSSITISVTNMPMDKFITEVFQQEPLLRYKYLPLPDTMAEIFIWK